jgi:predicted NAD-dependent protein-ADP-ribosyltransferase YbiA (DUF1768 family)
MAAPVAAAPAAAPAAAAPAAAAPAAANNLDLSEYIREIRPYNEEQEKRISMFFKKKERFSSLFTYNKAGDLTVFNKAGTLEDTIRLKTFVPLDPTQREIMDQERTDAIGEAQLRYEGAIEALRAAMEQYKISGAKQAILAAQKAANEADQVLTRVRYGTREVKSIMNPEVRSVQFDKPKEHRKLFSTGDPFKKELYRLIILEHPHLKFNGTYIDTPVGEEKEEEEVKSTEDRDSDASVRQKLRDGRWARIFFEADDGPSGFLSPFWPVEFTMDSDTGESIRYLTASQAWEYARAKEAGNENLMKTILQTRSTRTMRFITKKLIVQPKNPKEVWLNIFRAVYEQHPELRDKLLATGTDALVFADMREGPSGTGFGERSKETLDASKWTGENAVGFALETLRYEMREGTAKEGAAAAVVPDSAVVTEEEQAAARTGAIIGQRKRFFPRGKGQAVP